MDSFDLREWIGFRQAGGCLNQPAYIDQVTIDSRRIDSPHSLFIALKGQHQDGHQYVIDAAQAGAKYALVSTAWNPPQCPNSLILLAVPDPLKALQEIAKSYRLQLPLKIIGLTGSFGKTMIKDLLTLLLHSHKKVIASPESFNSQIGVPLSLLTLSKQHELAIIETAISQKGEMDLLADLVRPDYTILTPIGKKHLPTLQDLQTIAQETLKLVNLTSASGWALLPQSITEIVSLELPCPYYFWDKEHRQLPHAFYKTSEKMMPAPYSIFFPNQTNFEGTVSTGYAYFLNLLNMAIKAAWLLEIPASSIKTVLKEYQLETMRTEIWRNQVGATFINDPYSADLQSIYQALRHMQQIASMEQRKVFVFGGLRKQAENCESDYRAIGKALNTAQLQRLVLFGDKPFNPLIEELKAASPSLTIQTFENRIDALNAIYHTLQPHDCVLIKGDKKIPLEKLTEIFNEGLNHNQCLINLAAIRTNLLTLQKKLPPLTRIMVIIKALAYGTDAIRIAKFLATCEIDILGVSYVDEAIILRRNGVQQAIFSIHAAIYEVAKVVKWDIEVGVSDRFFLESLAEEAQKQHKCIKVHLHIDTGMARFGCRPEEALDLASFIMQCPYLILEGMMTHFACAEDPQQDTFTRTQIQRFDEVIRLLKSHQIEAQWLHAANSSGAIRFHLPQYNMVRIGLAAYGLYASEAVKISVDLRLALSLTSRVVGINICKRGETISYGRSYRIEKDQQIIAVLPIGYFDGLHRHYSHQAAVMIRGKKAPMVGKICMDYMMVDVTEIPQVRIGDTVLIFGEDELGQYLSPEDLALQGNSIIHELITCLGPRIQRIFIYEEGDQIR